MPSGDAQRTWFPEMIEMLRTEYDATLSIPEFVAFTDRLDGILQRIRAGRHIVPPMFWCPCCGKRVRSAKPRVSVRAAILALGRFGIADRPMVKALEKSGNITGKKRVWITTDTRSLPEQSRQMHLQPTSAYTLLIPI